MVNSPKNWPVEAKVKAAAIGQFVLGLVLVAVVGGLTDGNLVAELPDWATALVAPILPTLAGWVAAYSAAHQYRSGERSEAGNRVV